jgi:hypothetical protein
MLSNVDLEELAKHYKLPLVKVVMKDELGNKLKNGNYIINLQSSFQGDGTHWTALKVQSKKAIFFDSFGVFPSEEIKNFVLLRKGMTLGFNHKDIQDMKSENCGYFCLAFLLFLKHSKKNIFDATNQFTNNFSDDTTRNDSILKLFFNNDRNPPEKIKRLLREKV